MEQKSNDAKVMDAQILLRKKEYAQGMEQSGSTHDAEVKGAQSMLNVEESVTDTGPTVLHTTNLLHLDQSLRGLPLLDINPTRAPLVFRIGELMFPERLSSVKKS